MCTLTAFEDRPFVFPRDFAEIELVPALAEDLKVYDPVLQKQVLRNNLIYWLKSAVTGKIEQTPRVITEYSDADDLKQWLDFGMIYIAKNPF
jgi:hypothetical protein